MLLAQFRTLSTHCFVSQTNTHAFYVANKSAPKQDYQHYTVNGKDYGKCYDFLCA